MSIDKVLLIGLAGNEVSKKITGTTKTSAGRTTVATGSGAVIGAVTAGTLGVAGLTTAPITVPLMIGGGVIAGIASLFD